MQRYERGKTISKLEVIGDCEPDRHGTTVTFKADPEVFETTVYEYDILKTRLRETAFLTKNLRIVLRDLRKEGEEGEENGGIVEDVFHYEGGIKEFVTYLNRSQVALYPEVLYFEGTRENVYVEVAMQHNDAYNEGIYAFANNIITPEGGTHLIGFKNALTKMFNDYARKNKLLKDSESNLTGEDIREGLTYT